MIWVGREWVLVSYLRDLNFVALLEVLGKSINELLGGYIFNVHSVSVVDQGKLNLKGKELVRLVVWVADISYKHILPSLGLGCFINI